MITESDLKVVSKRPPTERELADLLFAWRVAKFVKSNAIIYAANNQTVGVGAGQCRGSIQPVSQLSKPNTRPPGSGSRHGVGCLLPVQDGIDNAAERGIKAVIQPGGSIRDDEIIAAADEADMAMVFTGIRHFRH